MYTSNPYNIYKQNSVNMASSQQLLLMLLDGAVKYTKIARMAILNKDIARAHKELVRVQDIFLELMITMDKNTKYMEDLYNIYDFIKNELAKAIKNQGVTVDFNSTFDGKTAHSTYKLKLNGADSNFSIVADATTAGKFEIQDTDGNTIATATASGGTAATDAAAPVSTSDNITATKATAAKVATEKAAYYDRDGNKIAENALDDYFSINNDGDVVKRIDAPTVYDALGNVVDLDPNEVAGQKDITGSLKLKLHVGADATSNNQITINIDSMSSKGLGINGLRVDGADDTNALNAIDTIKESIQKVSDQRSALGAVQNRLEHTISNLDNVVENTTSAESRIRDTDMAEEMVNYSKNNILQQAGQSMLAQANQANQGVLSLLQ